MKKYSITYKDQYENSLQISKVREEKEETVNVCLEIEGYCFYIPLQEFESFLKSLKEDVEELS